ncbi:MAG TPA: hypothetical protein VK620_20320, partial [Bradyrhizobium sp.]|nr:hypothetical protein [Bradyrhizobium sp.]
LIRGVQGWGMGPILRIGKNQRSPPFQRPPNRSNNDATFMFCKIEMIFAACVVPIGKLFEKNTAGRQVGSGQCSTAESP